MLTSIITIALLALLCLYVGVAGYHIEQIRDMLRDLDR